MISSSSRSCSWLLFSTFAWRRPSFWLIFFTIFISYPPSSIFVLCWFSLILVRGFIRSDLFLWGLLIAIFTFIFASKSTLKSSSCTLKYFNVFPTWIHSILWARKLYWFFIELSYSFSLRKRRRKLRVGIVIWRIAQR